MISTQVIATSIEELRAITRVDLCVYDPDGTVVASTFDSNDIQTTLIEDFSRKGKELDVGSSDYTGNSRT